MSKYAILYDPATGKESHICARSCTDKDRSQIFLCPSCRTRLWLRYSPKGHPHFYGDHSRDCSIGTFSARHTIVVPDGFLAPLEAIISSKDRPFETERATHSGAPTAPTHEETDDDDLPSVMRGPKTLRSARDLHRQLWSLPLDTPLSIDGSLTVGDLIIREDSFVACRDAGFDDEIRLAKVRRVNPSTLAPALKKSGYLVFRDAHSRSDADAIFFLVKLRERTQHKRFFELVAGADGVRSKSKHLVLLGKWHRMLAPSVRAYYAEINSRCYHFINEKFS